MVGGRRGRFQGGRREEMLSLGLEEGGEVALRL